MLTKISIGFAASCCCVVSIGTAQTLSTSGLPETANAPSLVAVSGDCTPNQPRFPPWYRRYASLRKANIDERLHRTSMIVKDAARRLYIEAEVRELDLNRDGVCDLMVTVRDPVGTGGDTEILSTIYLARRTQWLRIGAASAMRTDLPSDIDTMTSPAERDFAFSDFVALHSMASNETYLVAWRHERVTNGFDGYKIFGIHPRGRLAPIEKSTGKGMEIYRAFKSLKDSANNFVFDPEIEAKTVCVRCKPAQLE